MWRILIFCLFGVFRIVISEVTCTNYPIDTDFGRKDCDNTKNLYYNPKLYGGCIPGCEFIQYQPMLLCNPLPCLPGYYCNPSRVCTIDETSCLKYYSKDPAYAAARWKPECLNDGTWAPKQCKGNRCFCFDPVGNRILGHAFLEESQDMTCACSRKRAELEALGDHYFVSLHCDDEGNYEPLQCQSGDCWCVEPTTGRMTAIVVPEKLMTHLPCYNATLVGSKYLRQCESYLYAQERIKDEFSAHGTMKTNFGVLKCQYDGSYGPYKISGGIVSCVWKDNSNIASYASQVNAGIENVDCKCAQDLKIFELAGMQLIHTCQGNGNYDPVQRDEEKCYCIDSDGFRKSEILATQLTAEDCALLK